MGSGTSVIEAQRLGRNSIGIELQEEVAKEAYQRILSEKNENCHGRVCVADSRSVDISVLMAKENIKKVQFVIFHPPYWDIIKFSDNQNDISNSENLEAFLDNFGQVIDNTV